MLLALLLPTLALADEAVVLPEVTSARVWPDDPAGVPAIAEHFPEASSDLGAHRALHRMSLDGCWRQHGALTGDLDLWFCADVKLKKSGAAKVKVTALSDPRPGLATCIDATLQSWAGPPGAPARSTMCRQVRTNISEAAGAVWREDPWAEVSSPGRSGGDGAAAVSVEVGRPDVEKAVRLVRDPDSGGLQPEVAPLGLRDRPATTARRLLTGNVELVERCWHDHAAWRPPPVEEGTSGALAFTLDITVGPAGPEAVAEGRTVPVTHTSVAACVAARLDPGVGQSEGSHVVSVPVRLVP